MKNAIVTTLACLMAGAVQADEPKLKTLLATAKARPSDPEAALRLARWYTERGNHGTALPWLQRAAGLKPSADTFGRAGASCAELGRYAEAVGWFARANLARDATPASRARVAAVARRHVPRLASRVRLLEGRTRSLRSQIRTYDDLRAADQKALDRLDPRSDPYGTRRVPLISSIGGYELKLVSLRGDMGKVGDDLADARRYQARFTALASGR